MLENINWCLRPGLIHWYGLMYSNKWQSLVNAVLKFGFHKMGEFLDYLRTG